MNYLKYWLVIILLSYASFAQSYTFQPRSAEPISWSLGREPRLEEDFAPEERVKKAKKKQKKIAKKPNKTKMDFWVGYVFAIVMLLFSSMGAIFFIRGFVDGLSALWILGLVFLAIGIIATIILAVDIFGEGNVVGEILVGLMLILVALGFFIMGIIYLVVGLVGKFVPVWALGIFFFAFVIMLVIMLINAF